MTMRPWPASTVQALLMGLPDLLPYWDQWIDPYGKMRPAIAVRSGETDVHADINVRASAYWQYVAAAKGHKHQLYITGPVIVFVGDDDYMEQVLS
jgi:hypothetical protein